MQIINLCYKIIKPHPSPKPLKISHNMLIKKNNLLVFGPRLRNVTILHGRYTRSITSGHFCKRL